jgi:hypothetical protein
MFTKLKNSFYAICLLCCYPLYSVGQIWLFQSKQQEPDLYDSITKYPNEWVNAHLFLMAAVVLVIPAYWAISQYFKGSKGSNWANLSGFFICLWSFVLFGQFTIDLCLVDVFSLPKDTAYAVLDKIQANSTTKALFYDNSKIFFLFKFLDFAMLAQIFLGIAMVVSKKIPRWAWVLFFIALILTTVGILIHPVYGRIIKRLSYALFSVSFLPIVMDILRNIEKKKSKIISTFVGLLGLTYFFISTSFQLNPNKKKCMSDEDCLIKTHWQQMGGFEKCTPDSLRLGCWSTALAQIVYYHKLKPFGHVEYTSRQGYKINETMDSSQFDFNLFAPIIDKTASKETISQMSKYNYYAALAVQKDFGTDRYMNKLASAELLEAHFKVKVKRYVAWHNFAPNTLHKLEKVIYRELNAKRPIFLHFANLKDFGHSIVVDGYCYKNGAFMIHTNQGQGGPDDGWYDFQKGILRTDDNALRVVYTFKPY